MLSTSTSQYLQPEYIQPLPSSLDVNNSPLALLAQTCSSIGKETGSKTSLGGSVDPDRKSSSHTTGSGGGGKESGGGTRAKSESPPTGRGGGGGGAEERSRSRTSFNNDKKESGHGQQRSGGKGTTPKPGFRVPPAPSKDCSTAAERSSNGDSVGDTSSGRGCPKDGLHSHLSSSSSSVAGRTSSLGGSASGSGKSGGSSCSSMLLELNQEAMNKSALHASLHPMYGGAAFKDGLQALHGSLAPSPLGALPFLGYPLSLDPLAAAYSASLAAHCSGLAGLGAGLSSQKSPASAASGVTGIASTTCSAAAALSPFVSYARVKTATGGTTLVPVCKDPYCTHCQLALHGAQLAPTACTGPGCGQCAAQPDKGSPTSLASPAPAGLPFFHGGGVGGGASGVVVSGLSSALCSHAAFSSPASLHGVTSHNGSGGGGGPLVTPYVCNWVQGSDYCGKRFSGSDELLQHLRSHTSASVDPLVSPFSAAAGLPLSAIGFPLGGFLGCPTLSPGLLSIPSYPRSLSPNSLLSAVRYHPYKPPSLSLLPGVSAPPGLPPAGAFPSLAAFYSPYAFYGQRIGAAAGP